MFFFLRMLGITYLHGLLDCLLPTIYLLMLLAIYLFTLNITPSLFSYGKITTYEPRDDPPILQAQKLRENHKH